MTLSIKAALLMSLAFIGGMSWVLHYYGMDTAEAPSVLRFPTREAAPVLVERPVLVFSETPGDWDRRFGHPSLLEQELAESRRRTEQLAIIRSTVPAQTALLPRQMARADPDTNAGQPQASPAGSAQPDALLTQAAAAVETGNSAGEQRYVVQRGDSLSQLARRFGPKRGDSEAYLRSLLEANPTVQKRGGLILAGEELVIPGYPPAVQRLAIGSDSTRGRRLLEGRAGRLRFQPEPVTTSREAKREASGARKPAAESWYVIQPNDTLARIAARHLNDRARWREIMEHNRGLQAHRVVPGMRIKLPPVRLARR